MSVVDAVVFDLGNVLIEWDPLRVFSDECLEEIDFFTWNAELDRGAPFADVVAGVRTRFPQWCEQLDVFRDDWPAVLGPVDHAVVAVVDELRAAGIGLYLLSNSSAETLPLSPEVGALLERFDGVLVSGEVGMLKPDPSIYEEATRRFGLTPARTWFVDDNAANIAGAIAAGWNAFLFTDAARLRAELAAAGIVR